VNTVKNCSVGAFINMSDITTKNVHEVGIFLMVTTIIPSIISIFLGNGMHKFYRMVQQDAAKVPETQDCDYEHLIVDTH